MSGVPSPEELIFNKVRQMPAAERAAYLNQACAGDAALARRIGALLAVYEKEQSFLASPVLAPFAPTITEPQVAEKSGTVVGPYKLLEPIGEGGFGIVFMAEQQQPVRRKVALKVLKPGMDTRQVIARFEAERQALALMDHPNIAKVLDAGATESGRPYFVMELVRGVPITEYCDSNQLTPRERLELFVPVCHAVQHAHQKGIIHRDIKPSNVLVTKHDGIAVVKVIDFGVAKALGQQLTDKTIFTGFAQMIGTPLYMSPEQAELSGLDIDTRTDIYSLGVLLYELLTGTTPFDKERLKSAAFDEIRRMIREEEPPKPSTRLSDLSRSGLPSRTSGVEGAASRTGPARPPLGAAVPAGPTSLASIAALRRTEPRKLSQLVRGDLDWIVMKALEKDRNRRYETANGFALDIQRYLADEPVQACPPSLGYRLRKFARRNRGPVVAGVFLFTVLVLGFAGTTIGLFQARAAQEQERAALREAEKNFRRARQAVDTMFTQVAEKWLDRKTGLEPIQTQFLNEAVRFYEDFAKERSTNPELQLDRANAYRRLGQIYHKLGESDRSEKAFRQAREILEGLVGQAAGEARYRSALAETYREHGYMLHFSEMNSEALATYQKAVTQGEWLIRDDPQNPLLQRDLAMSLAGIAIVLHETSSAAEAEQAYRRSLSLLRALPQDVAEVPDCRLLLGLVWSELSYVLLNSGGRTDEARSCTARGHEIYAKLVADFPEDPKFRNELAWSLQDEARWLNTTDPRKAEESLRQGLMISKQLVVESPSVPDYVYVVGIFHRELAGWLRSASRIEEAATAEQNAVESFEKVLTEFPDCLRASKYLADWIQARKSLTDLLQSLGRMDEAAKARMEALSKTKQFLSRQLQKFTAKPAKTADDLETMAATYQGLADMLKSSGQPQEAEKAYAKGLDLYRELASLHSGHNGYERQFWNAVAGLSNLLLNSGRFEEAEQTWTKAIEKWPDYAPARRNRAELFMRLGLFKEGAGDFARGFHLEEAPDSLTFLLHAILRRYVDDDPGYREACRRMLARFADSTNPDDCSCVARALVISPEPGVEPSRAVEFAKRAMARDKVADRVAHVGLAHYRAGDFERAVSALEESLALDANFNPPDVHSTLAMALHRLGKKEQARAALAKARSARQERIEAMLTDVAFRPDGWSKWNFVFGELFYTEAYTLLHGAPPQDPYTLLLHGRGLRAIGRVDEALSDFSKTIELNPRLWEPWSDRAFVHFHRQHWEAAVADFSRAIDLAPGVHTNWWHRGHCCLNLAQWDKAAANFGYVVEHWPDGAEGWYLHAQALAQLNQPDKAIADLREAIARGFNNADWLKNDSRLDPLRGREDFDELLQKLERKEN